MKSYQPTSTPPKLDINKVAVIKKHLQGHYSLLAGKRNHINGIICLDCHTFVYSVYRHDFVRCNCPRYEVDIESPKWDPNKNIGCFIDGGMDYTRTGGWPERRLWANINTNTGQISVTLNPV